MDSLRSWQRVWQGLVACEGRTAKVGMLCFFRCCAYSLQSSSEQYTKNNSFFPNGRPWQCSFPTINDNNMNDKNIVVESRMRSFLEAEMLSQMRSISACGDLLGAVVCPLHLFDLHSFDRNFWLQCGLPHLCYIGCLQIFRILWMQSLNQIDFSLWFNAGSVCSHCDLCFYLVMAIPLCSRWHFFGLGLRFGDHCLSIFGGGISP